jgi:hypothetical protein
VCASVLQGQVQQQAGLWQGPRQLLRQGQRQGLRLGLRQLLRQGQRQGLRLGLRQLLRQGQPQGLRRGQRLGHALGQGVQPGRAPELKQPRACAQCA